MQQSCMDCIQADLQVRRLCASSCPVLQKKSRKGDGHGKKGSKKDRAAAEQANGSQRQLPPPNQRQLALPAGSSKPGGDAAASGKKKKAGEQHSCACSKLEAVAMHAAACGSNSAALWLITNLPT